MEQEGRACFFSCSMHPNLGRHTVVRKSFELRAEGWGDMTAPAA
jgi:hypothetical protein